MNLVKIIMPFLIATTAMMLEEIRLEYIKNNQSINNE